MTTLPKMVVFDLGGVLVQIHRSALQALHSLDGAPDKQVNFRNPSAYLSLNGRYQAGQLTLDELLSSLQSELTEPVSLDVLRAAHDSILRGEYDGAGLAVERLRSQGVATCVLSNTCSRHWQRLKSWESVRLASSDGCFLSFELGAVKPDVAIYKMVQDALGLQPSDIAFVDDSAMNIEAARSMGWRASLIDFDREDSQALEAAFRGFGFDV